MDRPRIGLISNVQICGHTCPWQLPQHLVTTLTSSRCCNKPCFLHNDPWQLPQDLVITPTYYICCNQPSYLQNNPWQLRQDRVTTSTSSRCCNQPGSINQFYSRNAIQILICVALLNMWLEPWSQLDFEDGQPHNCQLSFFLLSVLISLSVQFQTVFQHHFP